MTRETKVGLLVGMGVILLVGIIVSDTLALRKQEQQQSAPSDFADRAQDSIQQDTNQGQPNHFSGESETARANGRYSAPSPRPVPTSEEIDAQRRQTAPTATPPTDQTAQQPRSYQAYSLERTGTGRVVNEQPAAAPQPARSSEAESASSEDDGRTITIRRVIQQELDHAGDDDPDTITHEVQRNESLYAIARHYYGNGDYWRVLKEHNADKVDDNGHVRVGAKLTIPNRAGLANTPGDSDARTLERRANDALRGGSSSERSSRARAITARSGDTLSILAAEHLGSSQRWRELLEANRDKLESATDLQAGMTLKLPDSADTDANRRGSDRDGSERRPDRYKVQPGDSLAEIAEQLLGSPERWRDLYEANEQKIKDPDVLPVGVELRIPG
ncbi:MAG: LysM peptidoglycan-binding domain-containing protein [Phycisphaeraceae bacterium]